MNVYAKTPCCITNVCGDVLTDDSLDILENILVDIGSIVADVTSDTLVTT